MYPYPPGIGLGMMINIANLPIIQQCIKADALQADCQKSNRFMPLFRFFNAKNDFWMLRSCVQCLSVCTDAHGGNLLVQRHMHAQVKARTWISRHGRGYCCGSHSCRRVMDAACSWRHGARAPCTARQRIRCKSLSLPIRLIG